jgi:hypothetical protein
MDVGEQIADEQRGNTFTTTPFMCLILGKDKMMDISFIWPPVKTHGHPILPRTPSAGHNMPCWSPPISLTLRLQSPLRSFYVHMSAYTNTPVTLHVTASQTPHKEKKKKNTCDTGTYIPLSLEVAVQLVLFLKDVAAVAHLLPLTEQWSEAPLRLHMILHLQRRRMEVSVQLSAEKQELERPHFVARKSDSGPLAIKLNVSSTLLIHNYIEFDENAGQGVTYHTLSPESVSRGLHPHGFNLHSSSFFVLSHHHPYGLSWNGISARIYRFGNFRRVAAGDKNP